MGAGEEADEEGVWKSFDMSILLGRLCSVAGAGDGEGFVAPLAGGFVVVAFVPDDGLPLTCAVEFEFEVEGAAEVEFEFEELAGKVPKDLTPSTGFLNAGALAGELDIGAEASSMLPNVTLGLDPTSNNQH